MFTTLASLICLAAAVALMIDTAARFVSLVSTQDGNHPGDGLGLSLRVWGSFWLAFLGFGIFTLGSIHG